MGRQPLTEHRREKGSTWREFQEEYRNTGQGHRDEGNKQGFCKCIRSGRKTEENGAHCSVREGTYWQRTRERLKALNAFFGLGFHWLRSSSWPPISLSLLTGSPQPMTGDGTGSAVILTRRPLHMETSVTHTTLNLSRCRPALCTPSVDFRLQCTAQIPWLQDKPRQCIVLEEPMGCSHLVPEIMPPLWPCLYPKALALITSILNGTLQNPNVFLTEMVHPAWRCCQD